MIEKKLSPQNGLYLAEPLDTWLTAGNHDYAIPEAAGSSARVFLLKDESGSSAYKRDPAFKVMRHDKLSYAKPLFLEEYKILAGLNGIQGLTSMLQGGFLKPDPSSVWPSEIAPLSKDTEQKASAVQVSGKLALFSPRKPATCCKKWTNDYRTAGCLFSFSNGAGKTTFTCFVTPAIPAVISQRT
jgi:hypothetical protein